MFSSEFASEIVTISAGSGEDAQTFKVHKSLLVRESYYAAAALSEAWCKPDSATITLEDVESPLVGLFVEYLYKEKIAREAVFTASEDVVLWERLFELWALGSFLDAPCFQNHVMETMIALMPVPRGCSWPSESNCIKIAYTKTATGSVLRDYLVRCHIWMGYAGWVMDAAKVLQQDLLVEFLKDVITEIWDDNHLCDRDTDGLVGCRYFSDVQYNCFHIDE